MDLKRIDAICIFDFELDVDGSRGRRLAEKMKQVSHDSLLLRRLSESFDWLFYRSRWSVAEGPHNTERSPTLPGFVRVGLTAPATTARLKGKPLGAVLFCKLGAWAKRTAPEAKSITNRRMLCLWQHLG